MNQTYLDTARLLTQIAPFVFADGTFALKGGAAINLFIRDMPRLSVDLDLVFADHRLPRDTALARINEAIQQSAERLNARGFQTHALASADAGETKLLVRRGKIEVKVEVNFVMRGTVLPVRTAALTPAARETLLAELEIPVVSLEDVYSGKPSQPWTASIPVTCSTCCNCSRIKASPHASDAPSWSILPVTSDQSMKSCSRPCATSTVAHVEHLPGIRWKLQNLAQLKRKSPAKFAEQADLLAQRLE